MADDTIPLLKDKTNLTNRIQREWSALLRVVESTSHQQMTKPGPCGWSVKDHLAHIAEWERFLFLNQFEGHFPHNALQIDRAKLEQLGEDDWNDILFERNRDCSLTDVLADLHQTHAQLVAALEQVTDDDLMKPSCAIGPETQPVIVWVVYNTYEHYKEHRETIQAIVE
ncbi:MAG: ClbS/DfsB family four-helix bundle protein [Chloroflexi bacterium]|nr:ClbS/DfsB family four-helix bundle protein [Chloroflexota bacterium]